MEINLCRIHAWSFVILSIFIILDLIQDHSRTKPERRFTEPFFLDVSGSTSRLPKRPTMTVTDIGHVFKYRY